MSKTKEEVTVLLTYKKIKIGHRGKFKVLEVNDDHTLCEYMDSPTIKGIVYYDKLGRGHGIVPYEYFEVGDEFRGEVYIKDINMTLRILPILNLKEQKEKLNKQNQIESWMSNDI